MINSLQRFYDYYLYDSENAYGQPQLSDIKGQIKMAIFRNVQGIQESIKYSNCTYIGLTKAQITDKHVIDFNGNKLKVLYVNPSGRFTQVYLGEM